MESAQNKSSGVAVEVLVGVGDEDEDEARGGVAAVAGDVQLNAPAPPQEPLMDDEVVNNDGRRCGPCRDQVDAVEEPKVRLRLNKAACERLIMAPFLLDPVIGQDIRARRDAARSLRLRKPRAKRQAIQKALRTAMVAAKAIARMRSRAIAARATVAAAKASEAQSGQLLASAATGSFLRASPTKIGPSAGVCTVARLRNQRPLGGCSRDFAGDVRVRLHSGAGPSQNPRESRIPGSLGNARQRELQRYHDDGMSKTTSSLGARTSSKCDHTEKHLMPDDPVQQFLTLLVSSKRNMKGRAIHK